MTYPDSVKFLYSLGNEIKSVKLGLEPVRELLRELGNPQDRLRIVHAAGTNGKGSTCAMIEAGLRAAGYRTGLYTSPHLIEPTERIQIDGIAVSADEFRQAFENVHVAAGRLEASGVIEHHPTYFETVTAIAFVLFDEKKVDVLVCETGLGGRLDATNVVHPELCVITAIDFDHEQYLGNTIEKIASEKAGIIKPGVPIVCARQREDARAVIENQARLVGAKFIDTGEWQIRDLKLTPRGCRYEATGNPNLLVECPLPGEHQVDNSLAAAVALAQLGVGPAGIKRTQWPGRLELLSKNPEIVADGAHNPAGARALAAYIDRFYAGRPVWMIYGTMRDKAIEEIAGVLFPRAAHILVTAPETQRALRPESMREAFPDQQIEVADDLVEALAIAKRELPPDGVIFITGSLYLVGEARRLLAPRHTGE
ncbi:MAG TPA: folylpolyglutamate synthase/dihydrofolate synthase family protein [Bryobacteraceae bacterium]|jgi:dihydrofolate synthase/folylpolyglutamate synthase